MTIKKKVNFFQIFLLFFVKWLWNLHNPVQDRELPKNVLILSQNIENKWKKSFSEESKLCPCWGTVGGGGGVQMITDYIGGEGSAETPKNDYVIYGWPLNIKHRI